MAGILMGAGFVVAVVGTLLVVSLSIAALVFRGSGKQATAERSND